MNSNIEKILSEIDKKDVRELVRIHVREVIFDDMKKKVTVFFDKKYAIHLLQSNRYVSHFVDAVWRAFGNHGHIALRLHHPHHAHDREMLVPHAIHY